VDARAQLSRAETPAISRYPSNLISAAAAVLNEEGDFEGEIAATLRAFFAVGETDDAIRGHFHTRA